MDTKTPLIVLAGATGDLGFRIGRALTSRKAHVRALVRESTPSESIEKLQAAGFEVKTIDFDHHELLAEAMQGAGCCVSALSGLREVIMRAQTQLLDAAETARVPRFIPSDFSIDFNKLPSGSNRNLDLRRDFRQRLQQSKLQITSIYNGAFTDMLTGQAPIILFKLKRVLYWGDENIAVDFTTRDDAADFTADAALDPNAPRDLHIAGSRITIRDLAILASRAEGKQFRSFRAGSLKGLQRLIEITRAVSPVNDALYPPWQGMQYLANMYSGDAANVPLDNLRYGKSAWTDIETVLLKAQKH